MREQLLYGRKAGEPDYKEQLLCTQPERFQEVRILAGRDGYVIFRETSIDLSVRPNFARTLA